MPDADPIVPPGDNGPTNTNAGTMANSLFGGPGSNFLFSGLSGAPGTPDAFSGLLNPAAPLDRWPASGGLLGRFDPDGSGGWRYTPPDIPTGNEAIGIGAVTTPNSWFGGAPSLFPSGDLLGTARSAGPSANLLNPVRPKEAWPPSGGLLGRFDPDGAGGWRYTPPDIPTYPGAYDSGRASDPAADVVAYKGDKTGDHPPQIEVPSPHAGVYPTLDEAAKAAAMDVPHNTPYEFGTYFPQNVDTEMIDFGDGYGPQKVSRVTGFRYEHLYTSKFPDRVYLGIAPKDLAAWFHNHPIDGGSNDIDRENRQPSPPDWQAMHQLQDHINSLTKAYILGPDNKLPSFWLQHGPGVIVK